MRRLALACVLGVAACGGSLFRLTADDNDRGQLASALADRKLPEQRAPINAARVPRVFVALGGPRKQIVEYDLAAGKLVWRQPADIDSRIAVGGSFVVALEGKQLVARDQATGAASWRVDVPGTFVGVAADRERAYLAWSDGGNGAIAAYDGASGSRLWHATADGALGAPAAQGGVVYVPYLSQWLSIIDGASGHQLARIRGVDEQISMLRTTSTDAYFGSKQGVFHLDARAAAGTRKDGTYAKVTVPPQLEHTQYGADAYDAVQSGYSAADRARVLWSGLLGDAGYAVAYFRFVFGFDRSGALVWAYSHPRTELVASDDTGAALVAISQTGDVVALDPKTGAVLLDRPIGTSEPVLGATFDADGWRPPSEGAPVQTTITGPASLATIEALVGIARDHDERFDRVKELAVQALAKLPGGEVTSQLLDVLADPRASDKLKGDVVDLLIARKDPSSLGVLAAQLATHDDYIAKTSPTALGPIAKAIAGLGGAKLDPAAVATALAALRGHLDAPTTQVPDLVPVIAAMAAIGGGAERAALSSHLLLYHADPEIGGDPAWGQAIVGALETHGGPAERELLAAVAADPRTQPSLVAILREALAAD
ncbi:MAG TPA: PQQ-binding-like beta-propeller repeat protein [Kofleriaceae bacterium]